jgi:hypothetical protein
LTWVNCTVCDGPSQTRWLEPVLGIARSPPWTAEVTFHPARSQWQNCPRLFRGRTRRPGCAPHRCQHRKAAGRWTSASGFLPMSASRPKLPSVAPAASKAARRRHGRSDRRARGAPRSHIVTTLRSRPKMLASFSLSPWYSPLARKTPLMKSYEANFWDPYFRTGFASREATPPVHRGGRVALPQLGKYEG